MSLDPNHSLALLGRILAGTSHPHGIVVVGGSALLMRGDITRATSDVDVIAMVDPNDRNLLARPSEPLPASLLRAAAVVAAEHGLRPNWLNAEVASQWNASSTNSGLPPGMPAEVTWYDFDALLVGVAGRRDLIAMKLYAAVDDGPTGKHTQDLLMLQPTDAELEVAREWAAEQDASEAYATLLPQVIELLRAKRR